MRYKVLFILLLAIAVFQIACNAEVKTTETCGDGFLDPGEACDQGEFTVTTCQQLGFYVQNGTLGCNSDCTIDTSVCALQCGDGIVSTVHGEDCEGTDPGSQTCQGLSLGGGTLACRPETCRFDVSGCELQAVCGDGTITAPEEQCEGSDLGGQTCTDLGYYGGDLSCKLDCSFDLASCESFGRCGDGQVQTASGEECDGGNLNGQTCEGMDYHGGALACANCAFDVTACEAVGSCGDNVIQAGFGEACDGTDLDGETCDSQGFYAGDLACLENCSGLDLSSCASFGRCGDDLVQGGFGEVCDGADLDGQTCVTQGYHGGTLDCVPGCADFDLTDCEAFGRCGDDQIQGGFGEVCDGDDLNGETCVSLGWYGGTLACNAGCTEYDLSSCASAGRCGDGIVQAGNGEQCDGANLAGQTCFEVMLDRLSGALGCDENCRFDTTGCRLMDLVAVPGGTFQRDETPTNTSTVPAFMMSEIEITRALFLVVMGTDPSYNPWSGGSNDPVQMVTWYAAIAFCNKASLLDGLTPVYSVTGVDFAALTFAEIPTTEDATWNEVIADWNADGYRLPTEMEWTWAAMGATDAYTKPFSGSDGLNLIGNYAVFGYDTTETGRTLSQGSSVVRSRFPNELGLYDLSGNVKEWVWDRFFNMYPSGALSDYHGPTDLMYTWRATRGGNWSGSGYYCGVSHRSGDPPDLAFPLNGFRVVRR
ncbi:formylglycine-generating enzyme family protein [Myxococcota bacterium]|nr:formylglycine-generating enzyme family protein [Myxococcota bacterium]MBU1412988.1 formylglycine-generating enzyme family protein [Myxococcota bacterium]MBU1510317.1 formylglycine-generating enzyme family protein [Myxococcota bacterium]